MYILSWEVEVGLHFMISPILCLFPKSESTQMMTTSKPQE